MKWWSNYIDQYDLVINGDTGDSCRETGTAIVGDVQGLHIERCYTPDGWIRHPNPTAAWHKDPKEFSRDQWEGLMCALIKTNNALYIDRTYDLQKLFRAQNGDLVTWEYNLYIRAYREYILYPLLMVLDLGLLISAIIRVVTSYIDQNNTGDDINVATMIITSLQNMPTPFSVLAAVVYRLYKGSVYGAWQRYYQRPEAPPMDELFKPKLERYL